MNIMKWIDIENEDQVPKDEICLFAGQEDIILGYIHPLNGLLYLNDEPVGADVHLDKFCVIPEIQSWGKIEKAPHCQLLILCNASGKNKFMFVGSITKKGIFGSDNEKMNMPVTHFLEFPPILTFK